MPVVHCKRAKHDVYIGRPSKWGNPFMIGRDGTRRVVIALYRLWLLNNPNLMNDLHEIRGKTLGCWCSPKPCHGDILLDLAECEDWHSFVAIRDCDEDIKDEVLRRHHEYQRRQ